MSKMHEVILIGYSGHAFVVADSIYSKGGTIAGYCDTFEKEQNPMGLSYLGSESEEVLRNANWIIGIGDNKLRAAIYKKCKLLGTCINAIHEKSIIGAKVILKEGILISAGAIINPLAEIGTCAIINTGAIVEHECQIGDFSHIAPGAVLAGNVTVGQRSFIGANTVVKQGVTIGNDVIVGAGAVVIKDIPDNQTVVGNPGRNLS